MNKGLHFTSVPYFSRKDDYMKYLKLFEEIKDVDRYYFGENKPTSR
jgi:hypothetical protein